ncbi:fetuin-B [Perognathus longimembris pacificus]|uniref:fetuin-B n=1 Tax=Perognathus longimembris pacificus TaxID=214514 RepID=UPI0020198C40|nr:fetuin-B [Perognathus longimembris pacificus]
MGRLQSLVLCMLAACWAAGSPLQQAQIPSPLVSRDCNDSSVLSFAGFALQDINREQKDGYVLSLNRVHDVWEQDQDGLGTLFYLTLDVLETGCHVLSKKSWKDCEVRTLHTSVYGRCKVMFYINKPRRVLYTPAYNCTLRPVSRSEIHKMCPDCPSPSPTDLSDPKVLEAVTETLAKFNSESPSKQYSLIKITRAASQWVVGPAYFVEYLVKESPCIKSEENSCSLPSSESVTVGLCTGSLIRTRIEKLVTVTCDFFESQVQAPGGENAAATQGPPSLPEVEGAAKKKHSSFPVPRGSVQYLPDLGDEKSKDSQEQDPQKQDTREAFPVHLDLTSDPQGTALDVSFLFMGPEEQKLLVLPFPREEQHSAKCPGPAKHGSPLILPP